MILRLRRGKTTHVVEVSEETAAGAGERPAVRIDGEPFDADIARLADGTYSVISGGRVLGVTLLPGPGVWTAHSGGRRYRFLSEGAAASEAAAQAGAGGLHEVRASLPGKILDVQVEAGAQVRAGDGLVVIEAMKMENELRAPQEARVVSVAVEAGQTVETGALLLVLEPLAAGRRGD